MVHDNELDLETKKVSASMTMSELHYGFSVIERTKTKMSYAGFEPLTPCSKGSMGRSIRQE